ncbi:hypothetical protein D9613_009456 [Agrocybe pediades]|uniref:Uncharacterized protein n=1 Tax=Agrocybe pediades TaxID=84607 RepID=A0A8H4VTY0_9AGAR|nr:hypothetical protein D9613_009456 [Agrocybe pediades]
MNRSELPSAVSASTPYTPPHDTTGNRLRKRARTDSGGSSDSRSLPSGSRNPTKSTLIDSMKRLQDEIDAYLCHPENNDAPHEKEQFNDALDALASITGVPKPHPKKRVHHAPQWSTDKVMNLSFCHVQWKHLTCLGVVYDATSPDLSLSMKSRINSLTIPCGRNAGTTTTLDSPQQHNVQSASSAYAKSDKLKCVIDTLIYFGKKSGSLANEAIARVAIDRIILGILMSLDAMGVGHERLLTEMQISGKKDHVNIKRNGHELCLTGRADYVTVEFDETSGALPHSNLSVLMQSSLWREKQMKCRLCVFDAKKVGTNLDHYVPQVSAEALAIMKRTGRQYLQWCLTTGDSWMFGAIYYPSQPEGTMSDSNDSIRIVMLDPIDMHVQSLNEDELTKKVNEISRLLICWMLCDGQDIFNAISDRNGN